MEEDKKTKKQSPAAPQNKDEGADKSIDNLIRKISESNESRTLGTDVSERLAKRQIELLEEIYKVIAEQNDRQLDMMLQMTEDRKSDERRMARGRIDQLENKEDRKERDGFGRQGGGLLGGLAATTGILGGLGIAFVALSTSLAALKDGASVFMKNADQAIQGLIASIWGTWKLFQGLVHGFAQLAGGIAYVIVDVLGRIQDLISKIPVIGKPLVSMLRLIGSAFFGLVKGILSALDVILWPIKQFAGALKILGKLSGVLSIVLIAFDAIGSAIQEFKKSGDIWKTTVAFFSGAINSILTTIKGVWNVIKWVGNLIARMTGTKEAFSAFTSGVEGFFGTIVDGINFVLDFIKGISFPAMFAWMGNFLKNSFDVTALAITVFIEDIVKAFDTWIVKPIGALFSFITSPIQVQMEALGLIGQSMKDEIEKLMGFVTMGLEFVKNFAEGLKNQVMAIPVPGFGTLGNAIKSGGVVLDQGGNMIKGLVAGNSEPPPIRPKENFAGKILQEAKDRSRAAGMTMIVAPQTIDNSTTASTNMSQKVIAPMTTVNTRDPAFAF